ncbi:GH3 auxin-responsive promoter family protein [Methanobrevibacter sp. OttesenSCG-928-K11]|nr:GH3 auxin-responsive promoter family protein [Methanobrevibacter sp. OttesenSCG-928-K11]
MPINKQNEILFKIINNNKDSDYGKRYDFKNIKTIEAFKNRCPITNYDDYGPQINLTTQLGEFNIFTSNPLVCYTSTSGTMGVPKKIPCTKNHLENYTNILKNYKNKGSTFALFESTPQENQFADDTFLNSISGALILSEKKNIKDAVINRKFTSDGWTSPNELLFPEMLFDQRYLRLLFALLDENVTQIVSPFTWTIIDLFHFLEENWEKLVKDIEQGTINSNVILPPEIRAKLVKKVKKNPKRAEMLKSIFELGFDDPIITKIWPKFQCVIGAGTGAFEIYTRKLQRFIGDIPINNGYYASSEALIGKATEDNNDEYTLIIDNSYFEFIPINDDNYDSLKNIENDENIVLSIDKLEVGKDYEILITNDSGLYRYRLGDVINITGFDGDLPKFTFAYRIDQTISIDKEIMNEYHLNNLIHRFEEETNLDINDFCMWADKEHYVIILEPRNELSENLDKESLENIIEKQLLEINSSYKQAREAGILSKAKILFIQRETHLLYRDVKCHREKITADQVKPIRVLDNPVKEKFFFALIDTSIHSYDEYDYYFGRFKK